MGNIIVSEEDYLSRLDNIVKIGLKSRGNQIDAVRALLKTNDFLNTLLNYLSQSHYLNHDAFFSEGTVLKVRSSQADTLIKFINIT